MRNKDIYIHENTNLVDLLRELKINSDHVIVSKLRELFHNLNNPIGYFRFVNDNFLYNVYIFPKIIEFGKYETPTIFHKNLYINYLEDYFLLNKKHKDKIKTKVQSFDFFGGSINGDTFFEKFNTLIAFQFDWALDVVQKFSNKISPLYFKEISYSQQSINGIIDIRSNITELNKTNIHQKELITNNKLDLVNFVYSTIVEFSNMNNLLKDKDNDFASLNSRANNICRLLKSKFSVMKVNIGSLSTKMGESHFKQYPMLYKAIMILLRNATLFFDDGLMKSNIIVPDKHQFQFVFFNPPDLFEVFVYDYYCNLGLPVKHKKTFKYEQHILSSLKTDGEERSAEPDFVVEVNNCCDVIDAKWKRKLPLYEDIIKLWRDCTVLEVCHKIKIGDKVLIYPKLQNSKDDETYFSFIPNFVVKIKYIDVLRAN